MAKSLIQSILLVALMAVPAFAVEDTDNQNADVGRYQISSSIDGLYFLDTATGELWLKGRRGDWTRVDSPVARQKRAGKPRLQEISLDLSKAGVTMPMVQRRKRAVPGSSETVWVQLGDITGGQVFVQVVDVNGRQLLNRTLLRRQEFTSFKVNDQVVYLQIVGMVNHLLDEDHCEILLTLEKPDAER